MGGRDGWGGRGDCARLMHGRSRTTIDPGEGGRGSGWGDGREGVGDRLVVMGIGSVDGGGGGAVVRGRDCGINSRGSQEGIRVSAGGSRCRCLGIVGVGVGVGVGVDAGVDAGACSLRLR